MEFSNKKWKTSTAIILSVLGFGIMFFGNMGLQDVVATNRKESTVNHEEEVELKEQKLELNSSMYSCGYMTDCWKLNHLLSEKWDSSKPKAAIYILTKSGYSKKLQHTLECLETNFLKRYRYPVILFHEKDFIPEIDSVKHIVQEMFYLQEVQFDLFPSIHPPPNTTMVSFASIGYRQMCRFNAKVVYDLPIMKNLEYYWRLDAHSYVLSPVKYDLFKDMKEKGIIYIYPCLGNESLTYSQHLWEAVAFYQKVKVITPTFMDKLPPTAYFYNNFEISRMDLFTGRKYQNYIDYIDSLGGIYYYRWGDAPIKTMAVAMLVPFRKTKQIYDLQYQHKKTVLTFASSIKPDFPYWCPHRDSE